MLASLFFEFDLRAMVLSLLLFGPSLLPTYLLLSPVIRSLRSSSPLCSSPPLTGSLYDGKMQEQRNGCRSTRAQSQEVTE